MVLAANELAAGYFDVIVIDDAAKKQASVFFGGIQLRKIPAQFIDEVKRQPDRKRSHLPEIEFPTRHMSCKSNRIATRRITFRRGRRSIGLPR